MAICSKCGKNHQHLSYPISYIFNYSLPVEELSEILWNTICPRCCLDLGYARQITEEEEKEVKNQCDFYRERYENSA